MEYVQVNIGRNVGDEPMSSELWNDFVTAASNVIADCSDIKSIETHFGVGYWEGGMEDSCHVSALASFVDVDTLREQLGYVAAEFGQDAVALIVGSELVEAWND